jgi:hypothetical protein
MYDDGQFKFQNPVSRHSNILKAVIEGKKSWGLWLDQWTDGIVDWSFGEEEILSQFKEKGIVIPESFIRDFQNTLDRKKLKRNMIYLEILKDAERDL